MERKRERQERNLAKSHTEQEKKEAGSNTHTDTRLAEGVRDGRIPSLFLSRVPLRVCACVVACECLLVSHTEEEGRGANLDCFPAHAGP